MTDSFRPHDPDSDSSSTTRASAQQRLATLFELSRDVTGVLDLDELLKKIPRLIAQLTSFGVFSVYLLDEAKGELHIAYAEGYPEDAARRIRLKLGQGLVGTAVQEQRSILLNDVRQDARYIAVAPDALSSLVVPLRLKNKVIGALNLLSGELNAFDEDDEAILGVFAASVAQAITTQVGTWSLGPMYLLAMSSAMMIMPTLATTAAIATLSRTL